MVFDCFALSLTWLHTDIGQIDGGALDHLVLLQELYPTDSTRRTRASRSVSNRSHPAAGCRSFGSVVCRMCGWLIDSMAN